MAEDCIRRLGSLTRTEIESVDQHLLCQDAQSCVNDPAVIWLPVNEPRRHNIVQGLLLHVPGLSLIELEIKMQAEADSPTVLGGRSCGVRRP